MSRCPSFPISLRRLVLAGIATVALLPPAIATFPGHLPSVSALIAIAVLGIVCTAAGLIVFFRLIDYVNGELG